MITTGVVIAGAGARGAYEAGMLSVAIPRLLAEVPDQQFILCGTSAGAINAAFLSSHPDPNEAVEEMLAFWASAALDQAVRSIWTTAPVDAARYLATIWSGLPTGFDSLLDSRPLGETLDRTLNWRAVDGVLSASNWINCTAVAATSAEGVRTVVFVERSLADPLPDSDLIHGIEYAATVLRTSHLLASTAIPVVFRPALVEEPANKRGWYLDGGVRLNTPIKPALELGADRVVVVCSSPDPDLPHTTSDSGCKPDIFSAAGTLLRAALVDGLTEDIRSLRRVNSMMSGRRYPHPRYRTIPNLFLGPPADGIISSAANRVFEERYGGWRYSLTDLGLLGRLLGGPSSDRGELLSFLFFDGGFHRYLIELGRSHAQRIFAKADGVPWA
jgi:NTE family protein